MVRAKKKQQQSNGNGANLGFEAALFQAADKLRNNMDAAHYKHVILGLIFLRYSSDAFEVKRAQFLDNDYAESYTPRAHHGKPQRRQDQSRHLNLRPGQFRQEGNWMSAAYQSNSTTWRLTHMNLAIRGIDSGQVAQGSH